MPLFADPPKPLPRAPKDRPFWRRVLFASAAITALAAMRPWTKVEFVRLFGELFGPPAWQSTAGFTCLCTSALVAVMALAETHTQSARQAVRPASLLLAGVMTLALALHVAKGPGSLRGVSAAWTFSLYISGCTSVLVLAACAIRYAAIAPPSRNKS